MINDEIQIQIDDTLNKIPSPEIVTLIKVYEDDNNNYGDVQTSNDEIIEHVQIIGGRTTGKTGVLIYIANDYSQPVAIIDY